MDAILFDIDGTLINSGGAGGKSLLEAFADLFAIDKPQSVPFSGRTDRGIATEMFAAHGVEDTPGNWEKLRDGYVERLPRHMPLTNGTVLPGVRSLLDHLAARPNTLLGLLTGNIRRGAEIKLEFFQLFDYFAFGGFGDRFRHRNDVAGEALEAAHTHARQTIQPSRVVVIGDTPLDVECARSIGARAIAVETGLHDRDELVATQPDLLLSDLSDLTAITGQIDLLVSQS